jgi:hypothetical protein
LGAFAPRILLSLPIMRSQMRDSAGCNDVPERRHSRIAITRPPLRAPGATFDPAGMAR